MTEFSNVILAVFAAYFLFMLGIGWRASGATSTAAGFFLGNRSLKAWVTAISSTASSESAWAVLGTVGISYKEGLSAAWFMPGCLFGYALNWFLVAEPLRRHSHATRSITIPDYLESHFHDRSHLLRGVSVAIIFTCMMAYMASQFTAVGKTLHAIFALPYETSILVSAAVVMGYTALGGFLAVAWTDFFQGLIMVGGLATLALAGILQLGGWTEA